MIFQPNIHVKDNPKLLMSDYPSLIAPGYCLSLYALMPIKFEIIVESIDNSIGPL